MIDAVVPPLILHSHGPLWALLLALVIASGYILSAACLASRHENKDFAKGFNGVYSSKTRGCIAPGTSPYLRRHEWDTSELDSINFERYHAPYSDTLVSNSYTAFRDMTRLAGVADSIQESRWFASAATFYAKTFTPLALFQFSCMLEAY